MVTLHVENITWLGKPYSICVREPDYGFTYTKQNCLLECEGKTFFGSKLTHVKFSNFSHRKMWMHSATAQRCCLSPEIHTMFNIRSPDLPTRIICRV